MKNLTDNFTFKIPAGHPDAGNSVTKEFEFQECESTEEAQTIMESKGWTVLKFVNDYLKANARSNGYQAEMNAYKPSKLTADEAAERMIRAFIRQGVSEEIARKQVTALLASAAE